MPPVPRLRVPFHCWQTMLDHVLACLPEEACGIVAGRDGLATEVRTIENVTHSPFRFRMQPRAQVEALLDLEAKGLELLAIFHSHPAGPAGPSATDTAEAAYPEAAALIWCCDTGQWNLRAFDLSGQSSAELEIEILPAA